MVLRTKQANETGKKKQYFLIIQMIIIMFLVCACSEKESLQESTISEQQSGTFADV